MKPSFRLLAAIATGCALAWACGDVPTLPDDIAFISGVQLPSPAVARGDTLRDSLGRATPVRVYAFSREGDTLSGVIPRFLVTTLPARVTISELGYLVAADTTMTTQIVAQVGDRLQTLPVSLDIVPQPDRLTLSTRRDSVVFTTPAPVSGPLTATVSSSASGTAVGVRSIIVRYRISRVFPSTATDGQPDSLIALVDDAGRVQEPTGRTGVDTTDASGSASRRVRALIAQFDSVRVIVRATNLRGVPLANSPDSIVVVRKL